MEIRSRRRGALASCACAAELKKTVLRRPAVEVESFTMVLIGDGYDTVDWGCAFDSIWKIMRLIMNEANEGRWEVMMCQ